MEFCLGVGFPAELIGEEIQLIVYNNTGVNYHLYINYHNAIQLFSEH